MVSFTAYSRTERYRETAENGVYLNLYRMNCAASTSSLDDLDSSVDVSGRALIDLMPKSAPNHLKSMYGTEFGGFTPWRVPLPTTGNVGPRRDTAVFW